MIESAKHIEVHCCDSCTIRAKIVPKTPADSGTRSWYCHVCGHFGIGSMTICKEGDWLSLVPIRQSLAIQDVGEHNPAERIKQLETALRHAADEPNIDRARVIADAALKREAAE